ncbi:MULTISPECIES: type II toxin-antitoxin system RelE/ParE family toxin [unclassified Mesorhizobium]|uniref:type II toxin-antitoxin system RelE/ParE family toxin n=1 Tax=unclassified Mesorhizobium TaxID=325217 RepID=UPI00112A31E1|nr:MULTISPECIES: type II toxin-antitoxin system RelE/ParE family toxin [unclassified Mesorhizobium]TPN50833.1 type II toxin-antitoxin system RelE/ParE family toxin [Mesorhizobium sp. B1-1-9]TPN53134.1 type II toxin-antitoxin system RelE/ParE family toxin [Mesorhizobium sp. B1-1-7]
MKRTVRFSPKAKADLDQIWDHSLKEWGAERAEAYIRTIRSIINLIDQFPAMAKNAENIRPGLLKYAVGSHVLFLRIADRSIDVVRILHQRMDYLRHL